MSAPKTDEEIRQSIETQCDAGPAENVVSTACPACGVRFAMVAKFDWDSWHLRCTLCGHQCKGKLKT